MKTTSRLNLTQALRGLRSLALAALTSTVLSAGAVTITFEEFPADNSNGTIPAARYSALGVTFVGTDDSNTWGGIANGDPGGWGLQGANGSIFSGFNGSSSTVTLQFAADVSGFRLDAARSDGSAPGDSITVIGKKAGAVVNTQSRDLRRHQCLEHDCADRDLR